MRVKLSFSHYEKLSLLPLEILCKASERSGDRNNKPSKTSWVGGIDSVWFKFMRGLNKG